MKNSSVVLQWILLALLILSACTKKDPGIHENDYEITSAIIIGNCNDKLEYDKGFGSGRETKFTALTKISAEQLSYAGSQYIRALRIGLTDEASECRAFIRESKNGQNLIETDFEYVPWGWSIARFEKPFRIPEGKDLYLGYEITTSGYAIGFNGKERSQDEIFFHGSWHALSYEIGFGFLALQAIAEGGEYDSEKNTEDLHFSDLVLPYNAATNSAFSPLAVIYNEGIHSVNRILIKGRYDGTAFRKEITGLDLQTGEYAEIPLGTFQTPETAGHLVMEADVQAYGRHEVSLRDNSISRGQSVYSSDYKRNKVLIELFTYQGCHTCPLGKEILERTLAQTSSPEQFIVAAHQVFYDDISIPEGADISQYMGISRFPMTTLNRSRQLYKKEEKAIVHPGELNSDLLNELSDMGTAASLQVHHTYDAESRILEVNISGETELSSLRATVLVSQNGIEASQSGATGPYRHDHVERMYLTQALGDKLTVEGGKYQQSFRQTLATEIRDIPLDLTQTEIIVLISVDEDNFEDSPVLNAEILPLLH